MFSSDICPRSIPPEPLLSVQSSAASRPNQQSPTPQPGGLEGRIIRRSSSATHPLLSNQPFVRRSASVGVRSPHSQRPRSVDGYLVRRKPEQGHHWMPPTRLSGSQETSQCRWLPSGRRGTRNHRPPWTSPWHTPERDAEPVPPHRAAHPQSPSPYLGMNCRRAAGVGRSFGRTQGCLRLLR